VNQAFVQQFLGRESPIGQSVRSPMLKADFPGLLLGPAPDDWLEVIGVVGDARNDGLERPVKPAIFAPYSLVLPPDEQLFARTSGDPEATLLSIKQRLRDVNAEAVIAGDSHSLTWWLYTQGWGQNRFLATLFSLFALLALLLAATGLYSVVSFGVTQRTQEVGIRMALGAPRVSILHLVVRSTGTMLGIGVLVGVALSLALGRLIASWAGSSPRDPLTLLLAAVTLILVATVACIVPAWRAARLNPMVALRYE
jgi:ABC-type antimicrobial peptide transport system permease subunit